MSWISCQGGLLYGIFLAVICHNVSLNVCQSVIFGQMVYNLYCINLTDTNYCIWITYRYQFAPKYRLTDTVTDYTDYRSIPSLDVGFLNCNNTCKSCQFSCNIAYKCCHLKWHTEVNNHNNEYKAGDCNSVNINLQLQYCNAISM